MLVKYYLTVFGIYRVLKFKGILDLSSITDPGPAFVLEYFTQHAKRFWYLFIRKPNLDSFYDDTKGVLLAEIRNRFKFFSIVKSSPQSTLIMTDPLPFSPSMESFERNKKRRGDGFVLLDRRSPKKNDLKLF